MPEPSALQVTRRRRRLGLADAALAGIVVAVVGLMIVPLPTWLLDLLIASNLASSVAILLVTLYVTDALKIAAFPTLLLVTTLVRLGLNVASTRLILSHADAGEVIRAFGTFVVAGDYVVGAVIFLILAIIQFVVIAKGSERVAEVGARFTLDAMPGKQMAIDAELRSGAIDGREANHRRRQLARESQFYGAMDGAMKFVKGDVIASFLITTINILGGLAIGAGGKGMSLVEALKRYGLLTIGDGLVSQIPALVLATAAGVLVTRVASDEPDTPLGEELAGQLLAAPRALKVAALFVLVLAAIPGLPALPFLVIGGLLWVASRARGRQVTREQRDQEVVGPVRRSEGGARPRARFVPMVVPWALTVSEDLEPLVDDELRGEHVRRAGLRSVLDAAQELVFRARGVALPSGRLNVAKAAPPRQVILSLSEIPVLAIIVPDDVPDGEVADYVLSRVAPALQNRSSSFLGISETQALLDQLEQVAQATVRQVVPKPVTVTLLADVLRRLVEEGVSIRDLKQILEALALIAHNDKDPLNLAEFVRAQLKRQLTHELCRGRSELPVMLLDPLLEDTIRGAIQRTPSGSYLALAPAAARDIVESIGNALAPEQRTPSAVLTQPDIRRFVRKLLENDYPQLRVVSYAELLPELRILPVTTAHPA